MKKFILAVLLCCSIVMSGSAVPTHYNNQTEEKLPSDSNWYTAKVMFVVVIAYIAGLGIGKFTKESLMKK
jgi:hypothetical protein